MLGSRTRKDSVGRLSWSRRPSGWGLLVWRTPPPPARPSASGSCVRPREAAKTTESKSQVTGVGIARKVDALDAIGEEELRRGSTGGCVGIHTVVDLQLGSNGVSAAQGRGGLIFNIQILQLKH